MLTVRFVRATGPFYPGEIADFCHADDALPYLARGAAVPCPEGHETPRPAPAGDEARTAVDGPAGRLATDAAADGERPDDRDPDDSDDREATDAP